VSERDERFPGEQHRIEGTEADRRRRVIDRLVRVAEAKPHPTARGHQIRQNQVRHGATTKTENRGRWQPGQSGYPAGKPPGARHRFSRAFLEDLAEIWSAEGRNATLVTAKTNPSTFFAVCARLIPANVELTIKETYSGLSAEDMAILAALEQSIPDANSRSPAEVLSYVA
jgi:hypothetical protein